jgi:hypothetical protein
MHQTLLSTKEKSMTPLDIGFGILIGAVLVVGFLFALAIFAAWISDQ